MGGGSNKVKETANEKAAAEVAKANWDLYDSELKGFEDTLIQKVGNFTSDSNMANAKSTVDVQYAGAFSDARQGTAAGLSASGVNPNSGKFKKKLSAMGVDQAITQGDTATRAQSGEQDKYIAGLQDVTALGMGQKAEALAGLSDSANLSQQKAISDSTNSFNRSAANAQLFGSLAGAGAAYAGGPSTPGTPAPVSTAALSTK